MLESVFDENKKSTDILIVHLCSEKIQKQLNEKTHSLLCENNSRKQFQARAHTAFVHDTPAWAYSRRALASLSHWAFSHPRVLRGLRFRCGSIIGAVICHRLPLGATQSSSVKGSSLVGHPTITGTYLL